MKIGLMGTGLMGIPMGIKLLEKGETVVAFNRTAEKLADLQSAGAAIASTPAEVFEQCEAVILMLSDAIAIRSVILSESCRAKLAGRTVIQMGTIAPRESRAIAQEIENANGNYLEAPVLGSIPEVKSGNLIVMVGGSAAQFQQWSKLLQHFSPEPLHIGAVGTAAALKLALNQLIASLTSAFALSLSFVQQQGVEVETFMQILRDSALYAPTFDKKLQRMCDRNYSNPNFPTKHLLKDTNLFLHEAESLGLNVSAIAGVRQILDQAMAMALADVDYSAIFSAIDPDSSS